MTLATLKTHHLISATTETEHTTTDYAAILMDHIMGLVHPSVRLSMGLL